MSDDNKKETGKRKGPSPAHMLLGAAINALENVTDPGQLPEIIAALRFSNNATGADQAPGWRTASSMLNEAAARFAAVAGINP